MSISLIIMIIIFFIVQIIEEKPLDLDKLDEEDY